MTDSRAILVAEDDQNDALLLQCALAKTGLNGPVTVVHDGEEARNYLLGAGPYGDRTRYPLPGIMVVDLMMPRLGGFELLRWTRAQPELEHVFIVVLTGVERRSWMEQAYKLGANLYLVKPLSFNELSGVIACAAVAGTTMSSAGALTPA